MGKRSSTSIVLLAFWASIVLVSAQDPRGTEHFTLPDLQTNLAQMWIASKGLVFQTTTLSLVFCFLTSASAIRGGLLFKKIVPLLAVPSLPCNVPNCSLNLNCNGDSPASAPSPSSPVTSANMSTCLVPDICGHGTCEPITNGTIASSFKCVCDPGYANVLNTTGGYCVSQCELNGGCQNLNLTLPGLSSPPPPGAPKTPANQTANAGCRGLSFNSALGIATALAVAWSFLGSQY